MKQIAMALILMVSVLQGATIRVPQDQGTIQAQLDIELTKMNTEFKAFTAEMKSRTSQRQSDDNR